MNAETMEIARRWSLEADHDIAAARAVIAGTRAWAAACYCAEQAAERGSRRC